jgi:TRAP-type C4-dicarboxylate transport system substrate-binding protein
MGAPTETLGRVQQGVVDVGVLVASYYTSVFPMTEIFELPIHYPTSTAAAKAIIDLKKKGYFDKEFSQFKLITMYSLGPYNLMSTKAVRKVEDLKGMKLRGPGDMYRRITEAVGGVPITMAGAEIFNALDKGIIDATWGNWEQSFAFKLQEATDYTVETQTSTSIHLLVMSLNAWNKLPQVAKDWLDNNFEAGLMKAAETWDTTNAKYYQVLKDDPRIEKIVWSDAEFAKFDNVLAPIFDNWKKEREAQGLKAGQALTDLYNNLKAQGIERPFAQVK